MKYGNRLFACALALWLLGWIANPAAAQTGKSWQDPVEQWAVIKFSHKLHLEDVGAECSTCHPAADTSQTAQDFLLPLMDQCAECHDVEDDEECTMCHIDEEQLEPYAEPTRIVSFNHKNHLERGLTCTNCHEGLEEAEAPSTSHLPTMLSCLTCHNDTKAPNACTNCHPQIENLKPQSHREVDWFKQHKREVRSTEPASQCAACHSENDCQTCHAAVGLQTTKGAFLRPLSENRLSPATKNGVVKQNVHELNYRFIHAIDFRSRRLDCFSCHDQKQFCADCHQKNQEAGFRSPIPLSHRSPDFTRIGAGSGGGLHAELAEKDIETCAACHDVTGADPVCITCHVDRTPGKGNDPKTHPPNFRRDEGDWHSNAASLCFQCHTNTRTAGLGFCGYCHGAK